MNDTSDELSPEARALLARASGGDDPTPKDRDRVRAALMATVAGGAGLAASSATSAAAASSVSASATGAITMSLTAKIACAVLLASAAVGGTVALAPWEPGAEPRPEASPERAPRVADRPVEPTVRAVAPVNEPAPPSERSAPEVEPAPSDEPAPSTAGAPVGEHSALVRPVRRTPSPEPAAPAAPPLAPAPTAAVPSTLADEVRLLASAQRALNDGDPATALARLAEHGRRFPSGTMTEEREAARVLALCRAGRHQEAQAAAARFLADRPSSPLAARVRASCE